MWAGDSGPVTPAAMTWFSCAMPLSFCPVKAGHRVACDGSVSAPRPGRWLWLALWPFSNHDVARHATALATFAPRAATDDDADNVPAWVGVLYQGEELGLGEADIALSDLQDLTGSNSGRNSKGRDGCRTPMVWDRDQANGGSQPLRKPGCLSRQNTWARPRRRPRATQDALVHHYRRAIAFRSHNIELQKGSMAGVSADGNILNFCRNYASGSIFCAFNIGDTSEFTKLPSGSWAPIGEELENRPYRG